MVNGDQNIETSRFNYVLRYRKNKNEISLNMLHLHNIKIKEALLRTSHRPQRATSYKPDKLKKETMTKGT